MKPLVERVAASLARYRMLSGVKALGVAVSGGADSVCLLHVLRELLLQRDPQLRLVVVHLNHKLRGAESDEDELFVRHIAASLGLPFYSRSADAGSFSGENLEQAARRLRREFFRELIQQGALSRIATAHTRSDQAETVLFRLLRGSGATGLRGILPVTAEGLIRPLLDVTRAEVEQFLRNRGLAWREDSSNLDPRFARNRIRHLLLPALRDDWNPRIDETLANTARLAADEESYWGAEVGRLWPEVVLEDHLDSASDASSRLILDASAIAALPTALGRRMVRTAIARVRGGLEQIEFDHVERLLELASRPCGSGRVRIPHLEALRSFHLLRLAGERFRPMHFRYSITVPGRVRLPDGRLLRLDLIEQASNSQCDKVVAGVNAALLPRLLEVRNWQPGDRYQPVGGKRPRKLKELFQEARVPFWDRPGWTILTAGSQVVWAEQFGPAENFLPGQGTGPVVRVVWEQ